MNISITGIIIIALISGVIGFVASKLAKKIWSDFSKMEVGDTVMYDGQEAVIIEKGENSAVIQVRVSGAKLNKVLLK